MKSHNGCDLVTDTTALEHNVSVLLFHYNYYYITFFTHIHGVIQF